MSFIWSNCYFIFHITFPQDPEINTDYPKTEHKYRVEFKFLKSAATVIQCESPALSIPTISIIADDSNSDGQEEATVDNDDDHPSQATGESVSWASWVDGSFLTLQIDQIGQMSDSIPRGSCSSQLAKKSPAWLMGCYLFCASSADQCFSEEG